MTFGYLDKKERPKRADKVSVHTFSPTKSTLELVTELPEKVIAFQDIEGTVSYKNTGEIDFPDITIDKLSLLNIS